MKKTTRLMAAVLAVMMLFSCMGIEAFAATADTVRQYDSMLTFGSSVSRGCGLSGYGDYDMEYTMNGLEGSYPTIVADACGVPKENRYMCTFQGETLASVLWLLGMETDEDYVMMNDGSYPSNFYKSMKQFFGDGAKYQLSGENGAIANSDLIVLELGMGDVCYRSKMVSGLEEAMSDTDALGEAVPNMIKEMYNGYSYVVKNYSKLLDYIKKYNPDAEVVIVGFYNMVGGVNLTEDILLPIGNVFSVVTVSMNKYLKNLAAKYGYEYADIYNVGTPASEQGMAVTSSAFLSDMNYAIHPSIENGLPYIARQVLNVLPTEDEAEEAVINPNAITIDLSDLNSNNTVIKQVIINTTRVKNYSLDGTVLTIPYNIISAKSLTIFATVNGKTVIRIYQLAYTNKGYTSYQIYNSMR